MTDLGPRWHFYWFGKGGKALMEYEATSKGEANYLIHHMKSTDATSAPTDFLNHSSWNQMSPRLAEAMDIWMRQREKEAWAVEEAIMMTARKLVKHLTVQRGSGLFLTLLSRHKVLEAAVVLGDCTYYDT